MRDAVSELGMFSRFFTETGEESDGTDYGFTTHLDGIHRQDPDANRIWDEPEPLATLLARESDIDDEDENFGDDEDTSDETGKEYGMDSPDTRHAILKFLDQGTVEVVAPVEHDNFVGVEAAIAEDDTSQGGMIGLRRAACEGTGIWSVGERYNRTRPDNSRGRRQRIKRARKAASASKAVLTAIAA